MDPAHAYCSSSDSRVHFGLPGAKSAAVLVRWPDGTETDFGELAVSARHELRRPMKQFARLLDLDAIEVHVVA